MPVNNSTGTRRISMLVVAYAGGITCTELVKKTKHLVFCLHKIVFPEMSSIDPADSKLVIGYGKSYYYFS